MRITLIILSIYLFSSFIRQQGRDYKLNFKKLYYVFRFCLGVSFQIPQQTGLKFNLYWFGVK